MVNTRLKKLKHHLAGFNVVVKERTTATAITEGSWGFEHTKACFRDEIIPFVKALKDLFNTFDQYLIDELSEVQNIFHQMEQAVEQHHLESKTVEVKMNQVLNKNERLLEQVISKDIVNIIVNSFVDNTYVNVHECEKCLQLDFVEKEIYDKLFRSFTTYEKHCISLEVDTQLNQEIFKGIILFQIKEEAAVLRDLVDNVQSNYPLDHSLEYACSYRNETPKLDVTLAYSRKPMNSQTNVPVSKPKVVQIVLSYLDFGCSQHNDGYRSNIMRPLIWVLLQGLKDKGGFPWLWPNVVHLNFGAINHLARQGLVRGLPKLKFEKDHLCSACAMGKSKKKPHKPKSEDTNYEKLYLLHIDLCGPMHQNGIVERRNRTLIEVARTMLIYAKALLFLWAVALLRFCTPKIIPCGLVPNPPPSTPFVPPLRTDWDLLFQSLFDELLNPPSSVDCPAPKVIAPIAEVVASEPAALTGSPSSTTKGDNHDLDVAHMNNDPFFGIPNPKNNSKASSSSDVIPTVVQTATPNSEHVTKWTKDDPLNNIIVLNSEFVDHRQSEAVYKLKKALIGLKQAPERVISQSPRGIFINQSKYALESLRKYDMESSDPVDTPCGKSKLE
ncbi:hypothetical protein Tco_0599427 [Tanacetum coccineum]